MSIIVYFFFYIFAASRINFPFGPQIMSNLFKVLRPVGDVSVDLSIKVYRDIHSLEFIEVYLLYGVHSDGSTNLIALFYNEESVKERCDFFREEFSDLYPTVYFIKDVVWMY